MVYNNGPRKTDGKKPCTIIIIIVIIIKLKPIVGLDGSDGQFIGCKRGRCCWNTSKQRGSQSAKEAGRSLFGDNLSQRAGDIKTPGRRLLILDLSSS